MGWGENGFVMGIDPLELAKALILCLAKGQVKGGLSRDVFAELSHGAVAIPEMELGTHFGYIGADALRKLLPRITGSALAQATKLPSREFLRYQFMPSSQPSQNSDRRSAAKYTGKLPWKLQMMSNDMRKERPEVSHYSRVDNQYCEYFATDLQEQANAMGGNVRPLECKTDAKCGVPIGEPGNAIASLPGGQRRVLAQAGTRPHCADHDVSSLKATPVPYLTHRPPDVRGGKPSGQKVQFAVDDAVFEGQNPMRSACMLAKVVEKVMREDYGPGQVLGYLRVRADGGHEHAHWDSVRPFLANIALYIHFQKKLDRVVCNLSAPGASSAELIENVNATMNLPLYGAAIAREELVPPQMEQQFRGCNSSMAQIRKLGNSNQRFRDAVGVVVGLCKAKLVGLFERATWKGEQLRHTESPSNEECEAFVSKNLAKIGGDIDYAGTKAETMARGGLLDLWVSQHVRMGPLRMEINKACYYDLLWRMECVRGLAERRMRGEVVSREEIDSAVTSHAGQAECTRALDSKPCGTCRPPVMGVSLFMWLPAWVGTPTAATGAAADEGKVYEYYDTNAYKEPTQSGMPGGGESVYVEPFDKSSFTAARVQAMADCIQCCKKRCIYARAALTTAQRTAVSVAAEDFRCSQPLFQAGNELHECVIVRQKITCSSELELNAYRSAATAALVKDLCSLCGCAGASAPANGEIDGVSYKQILPLCGACVDNSQPYRAYGKGQTKARALEVKHSGGAATSAQKMQPQDNRPLQHPPQLVGSSASQSTIHGYFGSTRSTSAPPERDELSDASCTEDAGADEPHVDSGAWSSGSNSDDGGSSGDESYGELSSSAAAALLSDGGGGGEFELSLRKLQVALKTEINGSQHALFYEFVTDGVGTWFHSDPGAGRKVQINWSKNEDSDRHALSIRVLFNDGDVQVMEPDNFSIEEYGRGGVWYIAPVAEIRRNARREAAARAGAMGECTEECNDNQMAVDVDTNDPTGGLVHPIGIDADGKQFVDGFGGLQFAAHEQVAETRVQRFGILQFEAGAMNDLMNGGYLTTDIVDYFVGSHSGGQALRSDSHELEQAIPVTSALLHLVPGMRGGAVLKHAKERIKALGTNIQVTPHLLDSGNDINCGHFSLRYDSRFQAAIRVAVGVVESFGAVCDVLPAKELTCYQQQNGVDCGVHTCMNFSEVLATIRADSNLDSWYPQLCDGNDVDHFRVNLHAGILEAAWGQEPERAFFRQRADDQQQQAAHEVHVELQAEHSFAQSEAVAVTSGGDEEERGAAVVAMQLDAQLSVLSPSPPVICKADQVRVSAMDGRSFVVSVPALGTIGDLRAAAASESGVAPSAFDLFVTGGDGEALQNNQRLDGAVGVKRPAQVFMLQKGSRSLYLLCPLCENMHWSLLVFELSTQCPPSPPLAARELQPKQGARAASARTPTRAERSAKQARSSPAAVMRLQ
jgi:hypothetical protein